MSNGGTMLGRDRGAVNGLSGRCRYIVGLILERFINDGVCCMKSLVLFFELNSSIKRGENQGVLYRNMAQYQKNLEEGDYDKIYWFSYDASDHQTLSRLRGEDPFWTNIEVLTPPSFMKGKLGAAVYSVLGPLIHWRKMSGVTFVKSNQVSGAWPALITKWLYHKPYLFRLGYPLSIRFKSESKPLRARFTQMLEGLFMRSADHAAVTSKAMQDYYGAMAPTTPITLLPNYVDVSGFRPIAEYDTKKPILFVGRLAEVKNLKNLIAAVAKLNHPLHIYGGGPMEDELKALVKELNADVEFKGFVSNAELMKVHQDHSIYILCSTREGLPKTLVEAMASGLLCVGTPTGGILELIEDGVTGYLTDGFDADALEAKLKYVIEKSDAQVGANAVDFIHRTHALDHAVKLERDVFEQILDVRARKTPVNRTAL